MKYYIDCEFDGHNGSLISIAAISCDGDDVHIRTTNDATDLWVRANVMPHMDSHHANSSVTVHEYEVGKHLRWLMRGDVAPIIIADSPVDIARFCKAISTADDGSYNECCAPNLSFEVHDVDCYPTTLPGAVQHNAWWDAMALRHLLMEKKA